LANVNDKLETTFHQSFNMVDLFRYPTIADLAEHLSSEKQQKPSLTDDARRRAEKQRQQRRRRRPRPPARGGKSS
jgi:hypothetical protein